jgi:luciferase family oxidoreductase group 1
MNAPPDDHSDSSPTANVSRSNVTSSNLNLSILDLAIIGKGHTAADAFTNSVALAQRAEKRGYRRVWYAEHHNMAAIASSATSVLIAHVAAHTRSIRLGAGGVMLPNHSPLTIAEQFGTLETLHPGRIDLGLGRAPGSDQKTMRALRRDANSSDRFPDDVLELQGYLRGETRVAGVDAIPGAGTNVPLYILGSSLFGAQLAALLGLPYAFASHFAPAALLQAVELYREQFRPSDQLAEPYVIAGVNVIAAGSDADAQHQFHIVRRQRVARFLTPGRELTDDQADAILDSPQGQQIAQMMHYSAIGTGPIVATYLDEFARHARVDEVMTAHASPTIVERLHSVDLTADAIADPKQNQVTDAGPSADPAIAHAR